MTTSPLTAVEKAKTSDSGRAQMPPIVVDLGKTKKKLIKALKNGEGPLIQDVSEAVEAVRSNLGSELAGKTLIPVVIVYRRKSRRRGLLPFSL